MLISLWQAREIVLKVPVVSDCFVRGGSDAGYVGCTNETQQQSRPPFTNSNNNDVMAAPKRRAINHSFFFLAKIKEKPLNH